VNIINNIYINKTMKNYQKTPFHLVDPSPWPAAVSFSLFTLLTGTAMWMHNYTGGGNTATIGLLGLILSCGGWFRDITREATFEGHHTTYVQSGIRIGMALFITSEVMFFFGFFWAFFHSSLVPTIELGAVWPPEGINVIGPWGIPFLNTIILLSSGVSVTWAHHAIIEGNRKQAITGMIITLILAKIFTAFQAYEYVKADFTIADSIYGTTFYLCTGFHGLHVLIGTYMLLIATIRLIKYHFTSANHLGFEAAAWYWHFVDVVWICLYLCLYCWGS
jgi:cytochrome c oxidase subunit 3